MKKIVHVVSGYISALSYLLSLFPMAGLDGNYQLHCLKISIALIVVAFTLYLVYAATGTDND